MSRAGKRNKKIWIDLDNSPHVVFFSPIKKELERRGYEVVITARKCFQVCELAETLKVPCSVIGKHYGKNKVMKIGGLIIRSAMLAPFVLREKPSLALSHGSRSQILLCKTLGIPSALIFDYEHTKGLFQLQPTWLIAPEILDTPDLGFDRRRLSFYPGIKEDVYVPDFRPEAGFRNKLGVSEDEILVTVRPPASEANYRHPDSERLFRSLIPFLSERDNLKTLVLPRNKRQKDEIASEWPDLIGSGKMLMPEKVLDGLNLIWHSDVVFSGGGTMNREAAALGSTVYSIFRGKLGAIDKYLAETNRLILIQSEDDLRAVKIERKDRKQYASDKNESLPKLVDMIESLYMRQHNHALSPGMEG